MSSVTEAAVPEQLERAPGRRPRSKPPMRRRSIRPGRIPERHDVSRAQVWIDIAAGRYHSHKVGNVRLCDLDEVDEYYLGRRIADDR